MPASSRPDKTEVLTFLVLALLRQLFALSPQLKADLLDYLEELRQLPQSPREHRNASAALDVLRAIPTDSPRKFRPH